MPADAHADSPTSSRPSVFISYASADRGAARTLSATLEEAGLDVWLDEEELGGGEAWDAKIRNQIRTCTYFMPVISATTEERREGYFRREWRFAVERTLDLADDVMFLVPVVIDDTRDAGARVPEKFFSVQWLRAPGGRPTKALQELARRLVDGEPVAGEAPPPVAAPPKVSRRSKWTKGPPPPFPPFPAFPEHGHKGRFLYDLTIWFGRLVLSLWGHLPRTVQVIAAIVIIFNLIGTVFRDRRPDEPSPRQRSKLVSDITKAATGGGANFTSDGNGTAAKVIESIVGATAEAVQSGRTLALITFDGADDPAKTYASTAFSRISKLLPVGEDTHVSLSPIPLKTDATDADILDRGTRLESKFVLAGFARAAIPGHPATFTAKLFDVKQHRQIWTETYDTAQVEAGAAAEKISEAVKKQIGAPLTDEE
jgi:TolB-like protein